MRILLAQINPIVGNIAYNADLIQKTIKKYAKDNDIILFPELALSGYPPEDLLFHIDFHQEIASHLLRIQKAVKDCHVIVGHPQLRHGLCYNAASLFYQGKQLAYYHKQHLPNEGVFDEQRYFHPGEKRPCTFTLQGMRFAICICEDIWHDAPVEQCLQADVQVLLVLNASPFDTHKQARRLERLTAVSKRGLQIIYVNLVGGQDDLLFDGQSLSFNAQGELTSQAPAFETAMESIEISEKNIRSLTVAARLCSEEALIYKALVTATKDYFHKNGFSGAIVGLSGGIDSALTLCIAVDALGAKNVLAVSLPSRYTSTMSQEDAVAQCQRLSVTHQVYSIESVFEAFLNTVSVDEVSTENAQARIRCLFLMALSNQTGKLLLNTSNKSELAVGYSTLYGDLAGGFSPLKDVYKTQVYQLAKHYNTIRPLSKLAEASEVRGDSARRTAVYTPVHEDSSTESTKKFTDSVEFGKRSIPERVLIREPSAELRHNQRDQDTLPPYEELDPLLQAIIEHRQGKEALIEQGFPEKMVIDILQRIQRNEYKRRQAPIGPKITTVAFGKDWRYPITRSIL